MRSKGAPHPTPTRPAPKVSIIEKDGQPTECKVTVDGVVVFDGVSRDALIQVGPKVQELAPSTQIPLMFRGREVPFHVMNITFDSNRGVTVVMESGPLRTQVTNHVTVSGA